MVYSKVQSHLITLNKFKMAHRKVIQNVMSEPQIVKGEPYTTKSGQVKRRKFFNPDAKVVKSITHRIEY